MKQILSIIITFSFICNVIAQDENLTAKIDSIVKVELAKRDSISNSKLSKNQKTFALVGYGTLNYESSNGDGGFVSATYNPIFLYKVNNKLSFNAELEVEVEDSWDGALALEFAEFNYQINNNLAIYGGKFLSPLGTYQSRLHPAWINKSINNPIGIQNKVNGIKRLQGDSELGIGLRGGFYSGTSRFNYDLYTTNGPRLNDDGSVDWDNSGGDNNNSPAIGGRIGFLPFSNSTFEIGVSGYTGKAGDKDAYSGANVSLFVVDVNYVKDTDFGKIDFKGQFNNQKVSDEVYPDTPIPMQSFNNNTSAYYAQLAYRFPNSNFELVNRIANFNVPNEVSWGADQTRYTITMDYWLNWNAAIKVGYDIINNDNNALGITFAMGL
jgi:hypothetical protein